MSERAKKLISILEEKFKWSIFDGPINNMHCACGQNFNTNFCPNCGKSIEGAMPVPSDLVAIREVEEALQLALGKDKIMHNLYDDFPLASSDPLWNNFSAAWRMRIKKKRYPSMGGVLR